MTNLGRGMDQNKVKVSLLNTGNLISTKIGERDIYVFYSQSYSPSVLPFLSYFT